MTRKHTFRKSFEHTISSATTIYNSVLDVDSLLFPTASDTPIISPYHNTDTDLRNLESAIILIDTTFLVYRTSTVSFSGATRCTIAASLFPVSGIDDGYMVSRNASCTDLPCSPTWDIDWHMNGIIGRQTMTPASSSGWPTSVIEYSITQSSTDVHRYFVISEINLFEVST